MEEQSKMMTTVCRSTSSWQEKSAGGTSLKALTMPKVRTSMPFAVYKQLAYYTCKTNVDILWRMGVFRYGEEGDIEIWSADLTLENEVMNTLVLEAKENTEVWKANAFRLAMHGELPTAFKWHAQISIASVRRTAVDRFGLESEFKLLHLGKELQNGMLADCGVGPGSIVA
eukprot:11312343-Karenia_brevis.AAC.1